jgi:PAS domain S-box-containing protein
MPSPTLPHHTLFDAVSIPLLIVSQGTITYANRQAGVFFGIAPALLHGRPAAPLLGLHEAHGGLHEAHGGLHDDGQAFPPEAWETHVQAADGPRWVRISAAPLPDAPHSRVLSLLDVTEARALRETLAARDVQIATMGQLIPDYVFSVVFGEAGDMHFEWVTRGAIERVTGYPADVVEAMDPPTLYHPDDYARVTRDLERVRMGEHIIDEYRIIHRNGGLRWLSVERIPQWNADHTRVTHYYAIARDITERRHIEAMMRKSEQRYRRITELMSDLAYCFTLDSTHLVFDWIGYGALKRLTGYSEAEFRALDGDIPLHPDDRTRFFDDIARLLATGRVQRGEYRIVHRTGMVRWVEAEHALEPAQEAGPTYCYGVMRDITEWREAEDALHHSAAQFRMITEHSRDVLSVHLLNGECLYASGAAELLIGYPAIDIMRQRINTQHLIHPDDVAAVRHHVREAAVGVQGGAFTYRMRHRDGHYVLCESTVQAVRGVLPETENIERLLFVTRDITQRRAVEQAEAERARLAATLVQERTVSDMKTRLMRTLSHEFRHPLSIVQTSADFLGRYAGHLSEERRTERLHIIGEQVKLLTTILDDMSLVVNGLSHSVPFAPTPTDLEALTREIVKGISITVGADHAITYRATGDLARVPVDRGLYHRMVSNLVSNAVKYSGPGTPIAVEISSRDTDEAGSHGRAVILTVRDHGIGIAEDEQADIFEPFFRGGNVGERGGTGLGLSIVKESVMLHGGTIRVHSAVNEGTTFTLTLPVTDTAAAASTAEAPAIDTGAEAETGAV